MLLRSATSFKEGDKGCGINQINTSLTDFSQYKKENASALGTAPAAVGRRRMHSAKKKTRTKRKRRI